MTTDERISVLEAQVAELTRCYTQTVEQNGLLTRALVSLDTKFALMDERDRLQRRLDALTTPTSEKTARPNLTVIEGDRK